MKVYIFRGAPASGKGTITKKFIKLIPSKVALLELDNFRWGFHTYNREPTDLTEEDHQMAYTNFLSVLENYCKNDNYNLVIEGLFSWDKNGPEGRMQDIDGILERYNIEHRTFYLKAGLDTLWKRNLQREYVVPREEFVNLYNYVGSEETGKDIVVDVENNDPDKVLDVLKGYI